MFTVAVVVGPDSRLYDVAVVREVFTDQPDLAGVFELHQVAATPRVALSGVVVLHDVEPLRVAADCDLVVIPGSCAPEEPPDAARTVAVQQAHAHGATVASLCTGAFLLAATGLLDGRPATTHWRYTADLVRRYPAIRVAANVLYAGEDRVWTSAGVTAGTDVLLHLVRTGVGAHAAGLIARSMVTPAFRVGSQAQFAPEPARRAGAPGWLEALQTAVVAAPTATWSLAELARRSAMSPRTLTRTFRAEVGVSPIDWVIGQRVRIAQALLESTDLPIEQVAHACGFSSADLLRKHFTRRLGVPPTLHRAQFRCRAGSPTAPGVPHCETQLHARPPPCQPAIMLWATLIID